METPQHGGAGADALPQDAEETTRRQRLRVAAAMTTAVGGGDVAAGACRTVGCEGYGGGERVRVQQVTDGDGRRSRRAAAAYAADGAWFGFTDTERIRPVQQL